MAVECPSCGRGFKNRNSLGSHYIHNQDHKPEPTGRMIEIAKGWVLGDASYPKSRGTLRCYNTNFEFMKWTKEQFGILAQDIFVEETKGSIEFIRDRQVTRDKDLYRMYVSGYGGFMEIGEWYGDNKSFPEDLELTPLIVKVWYSCDGNLNNRQGRKPYARISSVLFDLDKVISSFEELGFNPSKTGDYVQFSSEDTLELLDWMGEPPSGMEYKWDIK
mgnify:CR=1 FL=1